MGLKFSFLGSGSRGNCTLVEMDQYRFLIDVGFGLKSTNERLRQVGVGIDQISAAIITHTHDDHVNGPTIRRLSKSNASLICRPEHQGKLGGYDGFQFLQEKAQVRLYGPERFEFLPGITVEPIALSHDSPATHGFLFDFRRGSSEFRFAYVADCGSASTVGLVSRLKEADLVALEFNHDEDMERQSGRPAHLIRRVLGPYGHLSNRAAAGLLRIAKSPRLRGVVQLHLSQDCNRPSLALASVQEVLSSTPLHQANQYQVGPVLEID